MTDSNLIDDDVIPEKGYVDVKRGYKEWLMRDVFTGKNGTGKFCPNVDDKILDWDTGYYRVTTIDITTGLSTWVPWTIPHATDNNVDRDVLLGVGVTKQSETWRAYLDDRQLPFKLTIDGRLKLYRKDATHYKVFLGTNIHAGGIVISNNYSPSGQGLGENIPLEHVGLDDINNWAIWAPAAGHTTRRMEDGTVVTVVLYSAGDHMLSYTTMLVQNTALVRRSEAGRRQIESIGLVSQYLSEADPTLLVVPINVDLKTIGLTGRVRYTDGKTADVPVGLDGNSKLTLHGLRMYSPTIQAYRKPLTLAYRLSDDEFSVVNGVTENGMITEPFYIVADPEDDAYSLKMFVYPTWNRAANRYDLDFWLYNIDRGTYYRVPRNLVEVPEQDPVFDGENYTSRQRLRFRALLSKVDASLPAHPFVQSTEIVLRQPGSEKGTKWQVKLDQTTVDFFGADLYASNRFVNTNLSYLTVKNGFTSREQWLEKLFYAVNPLFDATSEVRAPAPTHFVIQTKNRQYEFAVSQWDQEFSIFNDVTIGETVYLRWIRETPTNRLELGVTGLPIEQSN